MKDARTILQIGGLPFDPTQRLRPRSRDTAIVAIDLSGLDLSKITNGEEVGAHFWIAPRWGRKRVKEGELIMAAGFPEHLREHVGDEYRCNSLTYHVWVDSCADRQFSAIVDRSGVRSMAKGEPDISSNPRESGGMSGGPVFAVRETPGGVCYFDLVGVIYQHEPVFDILKAVHSDLLEEDGAVR